MRNLIELLLRPLTPDSCLGCDTLGAVLCDECSSVFTYPDRCFHCKNPSLGGLTCKKCKKHTAIDAQCVVTSHESLGKKLVYAAKYGASREGADIMGRLIATKLPYLDGASAAILPIPTTPSRQRQRGFDQAVRIAQSIARKRRLPFRHVLRRITKSHQIGAGRKERFAHMKEAFGIPRGQDFSGKTIIIHDDVVTTGATMEAAATLVKTYNAHKIIAAYFARAE